MTVYGTQSGMTIAESLRKRFEQVFGTSGCVFRAPGRVNLIGEHTDYNDGFVMPAAIGFYTYVAVGAREDRKLVIHSDQFRETLEFSCDQLTEPSRKHWSDYVRGVAAVLQSAGHQLRGANLLVSGEVPLGAGLSSSAALEVSTALALAWNSSLKLEKAEVVKLCQRAEHKYTGTLCGIMDQFISVFGRADHALMLDCRSLDYELLPVPENVRVVICNTTVKHELAGGEYNRRRADCEAGVEHLKALLPGIRALRDVAAAQLDLHRAGLSDRVYRRCRHVVTEDQRVMDAADALKAGDVSRFGQLMYASHTSLREDYEVSCVELDLLVEIASGLPGVYGARMTGGGFGGCTVNLVAAEAVTEFKTRIAERYQEKTGKVLPVYVCAAAQGAGPACETGD